MCGHVCVSLISPSVLIALSSKSLKPSDILTLVTKFGSELFLQQ